MQAAYMTYKMTVHIRNNLQYRAMCFRLLSLIKHNLITKSNIRQVHKYKFDMETAYFRQLEGSNQFQFSFQYVNSDMKINRQFNFCRQLSENVESLLNRVSTNVEKIYNKKNKKKIKQEAGACVSDNVKAHLYYENKSEVDGAVSCEYLFKNSDNLVLKLMDKQYKIAINHPWINSISLPTSMLASFPVYPIKFDAFSTDRKVSEFKWYKSLNQQNWVPTGEGYIFVPSTEEINHYLKLACLPKNDKSSGPTAEVVSTSTVQASPGYCPFETRHKFTTNLLKEKEFRVVSYNILADLYCDSDFSRTVLFPYCPPYALAIDYRKQLILKEIIGYNADIICLQEVDYKVHDCDLHPAMSAIGLESVFNKKGGQVNEGLACFYRSSRFSFIDSNCIVLGEELEKDPLFADLFERISVNTQLKERIVARTTSLQTTVLESLENNEILLVANIHLYFHPDADHIRLLQGGISIRYVNNAVEKLKQKYPDKRISIIFCGDFNSVPECGIYELFTKGFVGEDRIDWNSNKEEAVKNVSLRQPYSLISACGTPKYTNYTAGFADCLDYIYIEKDNFEVTQVVPLPSLEELTEYTALPSVVAPSDHVALIADIKWS